MKKIFNITIMAIAMCSVMLSCKKNGETEKPSQLQLDMTSMSWDGTSATLNDGDKAGVYAAQGGESLAGERFADNVEFVREGGLFKASPEVLLPQDGSFVVAYMPAGAVELPKGTDVATVNVETDQSNISAYLRSDLMAGSVSVPEQTKEAVSLALRHLFSKVNIELSSQSVELEDLANALTSVKLDASAQVNMAAGDVVSSSQPAAITPRGKFEIEGDLCKGVSFVAVPQTISADAEVVELTVNGNTSMYSLGKELKMTSGMEYTLSIFINKVGDRYALDIDVTEHPWGAGNDIDMDIDQEVDEIEDLVDIDGNIYGVVKVGSQYWMTSNLIVTKYNDGTPIPHFADAAEWDAVVDTKEGAYCYYKEDEEMKAKYGLLYNWHAVDSGKLCPEGWHVPTVAEFKMLLSQFGGETLAGEALKSQSGWRDYRNEVKDEYQGSNSSQFNAFPGGYRTEVGAYLNEGKFGYWWCSSTADEFNADAIYLYFGNPVVVPITTIYRTGYSVRCIKY